MGKNRFGFHVQAHRGASCELQENTVPSFRKAIEVGADSIELDVHVSKDGVVVVFHDFLVSPKSCQGIRSEVPIHSLSWTEISHLEVRNPKRLRQFHHIEGDEAKIPKLIDVFQALTNDPITIDIEMKTDLGHPDWSVSPKEFAEKVVADIEAHWKGKAVALRSFDYRILEEVRRLNATLPIIALTPDSLTEYQAIAEALKPVLIAPWKDSITKEQIGWLKKMGIEVMPYTVNKKEDWEKFRDWGAFGVTTDDPRGLIAFLKTCA